MVASQPQCQHNQTRIQSHGHHAKVLPAIQIHNVSTTISATAAESQDMMVLDDIGGSHQSTPAPSDESTMDIDSEPVASSSSIHSTVGNTGSLSGHHGNATDALNLLRPSGSRKRSKRSHAVSGITSTTFVTGASHRAKRKCRLCEDAGHDGSDCPGSGKRSQCPSG